ncbi:hypothetical protein EDB84DRAFT_1567329 [Lactarius hengduanensis]|nr:hypothetical protein EDB84DRAFT_1567329 [Lactarius hengduanensis]
MPIGPPSRPATPAPNEAVSDKTLHFDYPGSDVVLRSCDSHDLRVPQLYLVNSSPVLRELIRTVSNTSGVASGEEQELFPVVKLSESGAILHNLLTFILPLAPILPSATENTMKLLAVAQKYQMDSVLTHVRGVISLQDPPLILPETALHVYFFAQKYGLHQEVLRAARSTLCLSMTVEDLEDRIDFMPGLYLRELWKYHERVRKDLASSLLEFRRSGVPGIVRDLRCGTSSPSSSTPRANLIPQWLDDYSRVLSASSSPPRSHRIRECTGTPHQGSASAFCTMSVYGNIQPLDTRFLGGLDNCCSWDDRKDPTLTLVKDELTSENSDPPSPPLCLDLPDANIIVRSSDQVSFPVRNSVLAMSSPFFKDLLSLPQPPNGELVDGLPVIQLSEDAVLLNSLISLLYPIASVKPSSYEKVFALLAACQKYDMESVQCNIRAEIKLGRFPAPVGDEAFSAYAIASGLGLIPEMENAARLTLGYPMTFESLGEQLRSFEGRALCDLVRYRKRCRDNLVSCLNSFFDVRSRFQIWAGCRESSAPMPDGVSMSVRDAPTGWLRDFFSSKIVELKNGIYACN